jgi:hypothetical protein
MWAASLNFLYVVLGSVCSTFASFQRILWPSSYACWDNFDFSSKPCVKLLKKNHGSHNNNRWNTNRDVKERYNNFIQIIKGKLEETTPKRKKKKLRKWRIRKNKK